jgi:hypothetical protein
MFCWNTHNNQIILGFKGNKFNFQAKSNIYSCKTIILCMSTISPPDMQRYLSEDIPNMHSYLRKGFEALRDYAETGGRGVTLLLGSRKSIMSACDFPFGVFEDEIANGSPACMLDRRERAITAIEKAKNCGGSDVLAFNYTGLMGRANLLNGAADIEERNEAARYVVSRRDVCAAVLSDIEPEIELMAPEWEMRRFSYVWTDGGIVKATRKFDTASPAESLSV